MTIEQMKAELHAAHTKMLQAKGHRRSPAVMQFRRLAEIYTPSLLASHDSLEKVVEAMKGKERGSE